MGGGTRLDLAQYRELAAFAQFASDLDEATQKQLARGTRLREVLKQPQNSPLSVAEQVALIYTGINGYLDDLAVGEVKNYCATLISYISTSKKPYAGIVGSTSQFTEEAEASLKEIISESKGIFAKTK